jgi:hypothetical protein
MAETAPTPVPSTQAPALSTATQIEAAVTRALSSAKAEESKIWTWIKANWHHVVGYASIVAAIKKLI